MHHITAETLSKYIYIKVKLNPAIWRGAIDFTTCKISAAIPWLCLFVSYPKLAIFCEIKL